MPSRPIRDLAQLLDGPGAREFALDCARGDSAATACAALNAPSTESMTGAVLSVVVIAERYESVDDWPRFAISQRKSAPTPLVRRSGTLRLYAVMELRDVGMRTRPRLPRVLAVRVEDRVVRVGIDSA